MIRRLLTAFTFPMLSKELLEQAQQKRTYAFRFLYCLILYIIVLINVVPGLLAIRDPLQQLGRGENVFEQINGIQSFMVIIFMPIITAGTISHEKERNTLQLLLLTRLSSWNIVFEKFLSRLLTMLGFLLMSLPLMAVAYALGGVEDAEVWNAFQMQLMLAFLVGAVSVACSSYCASSFAALMMSYLISLLAISVLGGCCLPGQLIFMFGSLPRFSSVRYLFLFQLIFSIPSLIVGTGVLLYARNVLFDRATVQPSNPLLRLFRWFDEKFHELNQNSVTRGIQVLRTTGSLPEFAPIAWRERTHSLAGSPTHLMRLFSIMMIPLTVILFLALSDRRSSSNSLGPIVVILWYLSLLVVFFSSTPLFIKEKGRQTLDVLLSMPISTDELLEQKRAGVVRLIELFQVVLWLVLSFHIYMTYRTESWHIDLLILVVVGLSHRLQLLTVSWLGVLLGAWQKHLVRALATGMIGIVLVWREIPRYLVSLIAFPLISLWYEVFLGESVPRVGMEWSGPGLEVCITPFWIEGFVGNFYTRLRESFQIAPWFLLISLAYQFFTYRLVRRWAYRRSKRDLPRLTRDENFREEDEAAAGDQISPAMGRP